MNPAIYSFWKETKEKKRIRNNQQKKKETVFLDDFGSDNPCKTDQK